MGTTNILDLNNRLTKVEQENVAQNSYTSLKNKPKINSVTLTGNKSLADIGAAAASDLTTLAGDVGNLSALTTTDKSSCVGAINELKSGLMVKPTIISSGFITEGSHVDVEIVDTESLYVVYCAKYDSATIYAVFTTGTDAFPIVLHSGSVIVSASGLTITITPDTGTSCRYTVLKVI